jgi:hypothetical protein
MSKITKRAIIDACDSYASRVWLIWIWHSLCCYGGEGVGTKWRCVREHASLQTLRNSFTMFSGNYLYLVCIITFRISFSKYSGLKFWLSKQTKNYVPKKIIMWSQMIKRIKLEKIIVCWGEGIIVGVEKEFPQQWKR